MPRRFAPEALLLVVLGLLLAGSLTLAYADFDGELRVALARGICVALAVLLVAGVILPARRALARRKAAKAPPAERAKDVAESGR